MDTLRSRRKARPASGFRAQLKDLTPEQLNAFHAMLGENLTYRQMLARAKADFGVDTSATALGAYYKSGEWNAWQAEAGAKTTFKLSGFELLISCPRPGVVSIIAKELPPEPTQTPDTTPE